MSQLARAFLAFDIDNEEVKKKLTDSQRLIIQTGADLRLVEPENIHITIRFLGEIRLNMVDNIFEEMKKIQFTAFNVNISGLGVFPSLSNPRVVWAGITEGAEQLNNIFTKIESKLRSFGFAPDPKGFSPHLTIARVKSARNKTQLSDYITKNTKYEFGTFKAHCLRLKQSQLTPRGPIYATLREVCS